MVVVTDTLREVFKADVLFIMLFNVGEHLSDKGREFSFTSDLRKLGI